MTHRSQLARSRTLSPGDSRPRRRPPPRLPSPRPKTPPPLPQIRRLALSSFLPGFRINPHSSLAHQKNKEVKSTTQPAKSHASQSKKTPSGTETVRCLCPDTEVPRSHSLPSSRSAKHTFLPLPLPPCCQTDLGMVQCERCSTWQHLVCLGFEGSTDDKIPEDYVCYPCKLKSAKKRSAPSRFEKISGIRFPPQNFSLPHVSSVTLSSRPCYLAPLPLDLLQGGSSDARSHGQEAQ